MIENIKSQIFGQYLYKLNLDIVYEKKVNQNIFKKIPLIKLVSIKATV